LRRPNRYWRFCDEQPAISIVVFLHARTRIRAASAKEQSAATADSPLIESFYEGRSGMSFTKKDRKIRSRLGKSFPTKGDSETKGAGHFAHTIAESLKREFGNVHAGVKTVAALTGANERAVKNWFGAKNGPSGDFLVSLLRHSDEVLETVLVLSGRTELVKAKKLVDARRKLTEMLILIDQLQSD
jgi:hypothetical protein